MNSIHVSAIDMGLERVLPVARQLGLFDVSPKPYIFTVAGTNGKGSTTATIAQICQCAGYKTALYQSPHLVSFNERIKINGTDIDDDMLITAFNECEKARIACGLSLSFFEMTTLSALWIFKTLNCNVWVLEIGLGGRLDVVNIIDPDVCVITNVGIDHTDWLGDTREKIGFEKAGIIRDGVPVIYGEADMPDSVRTVIGQKNATCHQLGVDFDYADEGQTWVYSAKAVTLLLPTPSIALINASSAVSAVLASSLDIDSRAIKDGLTAVQLAGRFDRRLIDGRQWVFDVGHNAHGVALLMALFVPFWQTAQQNSPTAKLHILFSMLADKDIDEVLSLFASFNLPVQAWHIGRIDNVRATDTPVLYDKLARHVNSPIFAHTDISQAVQALQHTSQAGDVVLCFGSFHTIGEGLIALHQAKDPRFD